MMPAFGQRRGTCSSSTDWDVRLWLGDDVARPSMSSFDAHDQVPPVSRRRLSYGQPTCVAYQGYSVLSPRVVGSWSILGVIGWAGHVRRGPVHIPWVPAVGIDVAYSYTRCLRQLLIPLPAIGRHHGASRRRPGRASPATCSPLGRKNERFTRGRRGQRG